MAKLTADEAARILDEARDYASRHKDIHGWIEKIIALNEPHPAKAFFAAPEVALRAVRQTEFSQMIRACENTLLIEVRHTEGEISVLKRTVFHPKSARRKHGETSARPVHDGTSWNEEYPATFYADLDRMMAGVLGKVEKLLVLSQDSPDAFGVTPSGPEIKALKLFAARIRTAAAAPVDADAA